MVHCEEARSSIGRAVDGTITPRAQETLDAHLAMCPECRDELETQREIHLLLASREPEAVPLGFEARLAARLATERPPMPASASWLDRANWRKWSIYLLPAAAVLVIFATRASFRDARKNTAASADSVLEWIARPDTTDDSLLVLLVTGDTPSHASDPAITSSPRTPRKP